jgi:long-subunit fatty acid transport protein
LFHGKDMRAEAKAAILAAAVTLATGLRPSAVSAQSSFEPGARAAGMGGAFVALADDTSALFYNPAGLVHLKGVRAKVNLLLGVPTTSVTWPPAGGPLRSRPLVFRGSLALNWRFWKHASLGLGFYAPHNLMTD